MSTKRAQSNSHSVWQDVKSQVEMKIMAGEFLPGERVPSVRKLAEDLGVSQATTQKVLYALSHEGVIEAKRGVGFFVNPYIREKLISDKKRELEKIVISAVEEAALINVDLVSMVEKYITMKAGQK